jgi:hypothetical protein
MPWILREPWRKLDFTLILHQGRSSGEQVVLLRIAFALVSGLEIASCTVSTDAQISVPALTLPPPDGFCELTSQQPQDASEIKLLSGNLARAKIELLAMSADCGQLEAWRAHKHLIDEYAQYQALVFAGNSNSTEWVKAYCADVRAQGEKKLPGLTAEVNAALEAAKMNAKITEMTLLGVLAEDADACYGLMLQKAQTEEGAEKIQLAIGAATVLKGRAVNYILYTVYHDENTVTAAFARHKRNVAAFLAANRAADDVAWGILKDTGNAEQLRRFISQFPGSPLRREAEQRLKALEPVNAAVGPPEPARPATAGSGGAKQVQVGSVALTFPPPEGFCELTSQQPMDARTIEAERGTLTGQQNELLTMSADCGQLEGWRARTHLIEDYARYQTVTSATDSNLSRAEWVKRFCAGRRAQYEKTPHVFATDFNARAKALGVNTGELSAEAMSTLGVLGEDADACYMGLLQMIRTKAGAERTQISVHAYTLVKGKIIQYGLFTDYHDADTLTAALARHKRNVVAFLAANRAADDVAWGILEETRNAEQLRRFISQFPDSPLRREAEERLESSSTTTVAPTIAAPKP